MIETDAKMPLLVLTAANRPALRGRHWSRWDSAARRHGPYRILPYTLPRLAISKVLDGGLQNMVDVSYLLASADDGELSAVRSLAAGEGPELSDDIENLITIP